MSALFPDEADLAGWADAVRSLARSDAGKATALAHHLAAGDLARGLGLPDIGTQERYALSLQQQGEDDHRRLPAGWDSADYFLIHFAAPDDRILRVSRNDARIALAPAEADFGLDDAIEGWLIADLSSLAGEAVPIPQAAIARLQLVGEALHLATVQGILDAFREHALSYLRARPLPWYGAGIQSATDDPHISRALGLLIARQHALNELAGEALAGRSPDSIALARHHAHDLARSLISEGIALLGASSASGKYGFDRYWRDAATHGLRHPPRRDAETLGRDFVAGVLSRDAAGADTYSRTAP